jgi:hypothetical protein
MDNSALPDYLGCRTIASGDPKPVLILHDEAVRMRRINPITIRAFRITKAIEFPASNLN